MALELLTCSPQQTHSVGVSLGSRLRPKDVVLLVGPLGVGKTTLARGIAAGIGVLDPLAVSSPSFSLVNTYSGKYPVYHVDLYRLGGWHDFATVGVDEFIGAQGVTIVEWGERLPIMLPSVIIVRIQDAEGDCRKLRIEAEPRLLKVLRRNVPATDKPILKEGDE